MRLHKHDELVENLQKRIKYELGIISDDAARVHAELAKKEKE